MLILRITCLKNLHFDLLFAFTTRLRGFMLSSITSLYHPTHRFDSVLNGACFILYARLHRPIPFPWMTSRRKA